MLRALIGAVAAAVAMYIIGIIFFVTPLSALGMSSLDDNQAAAVQQALAANVPATGTYYVPDPGKGAAQSTMFSRGPVALVGYNMRGFSPSDSTVMVSGFVFMLIVALFMAVFLYWLSQHVRGFAERLKIAAVGIVGAAIFMRLSGPVWDHQDWAYAIYVLVSDVVMLIVAAIVILKLLPSQSVPATPAGSTSDL
jgi:hypothetical protein